MDRDADLQRAYELIETDSLSDARTILEQIVASDRNNADAWWMLAHAVDNPDEARNALNNVLRIDSAYPGAQTLFNTLQAATPGKIAAATPSAGIARLPAAPAPAATSDDDFDFDFDDEDDLGVMDLSDEDDFDFELDDEEDIVIQKTGSVEDDFDLDDDFGDEFDDDEEDEDEEDDERSPGRRIILAAIALLALLAVIVVIFVVNPFKPASTTPPPTLPTQQVGEVATNTPDIAPTTDVGTTTSIEPAVLQNFYNALSTTQVVADSGSVETTSAGNTLAFTICVESLRTLPSIIPDAIRAIASQSPGVADQVDAVGARFVNCTNNNTPLRFVVVSMVDALDFANGTLSDEELNGRLQAIQP